MNIPKLRLVGCLYRGPKDDVLSFLYGSWDRLKEIKNTHVPTRQIQYACDSNDDYSHFIGVELNEIDSIPHGMQAWDFDGDTWTVLEEKDGQISVIEQTRVDWKWLNVSAPEIPIGEFAAMDSAGCARREYVIMSHSWLGCPDKDNVYLVDYDPSWPDQYEQMKQHILEVLGNDVALRIEHYGSTAISGMPAKPIIDILVEISSWEECRKRAIPAFKMPGNEYWHYNDHICFILRDQATGVRTHHVHMAPDNHRLWEGLVFRDYLRAHSEDAARYVDLKCKLVQQYRSDREAYTNAKEAFVSEIVGKALQVGI